MAGICGEINYLFTDDCMVNDRYVESSNMEIKRNMESRFACPLLKKVIDDGYCYDINMVVGNLIKPTVLKDEINKNEAIEICNSCEFNQMK